MNTSQKSIVYDFPKLPSQKINSIFSGNIQYSVTGKENQPNISIIQKYQKNHFVSKQVYIFSNIHNVGDEDNVCSGELVIENSPITNGGKNLYICVPLITSHYDGIYSSPNVLDEIIQDTKSIDELEINSVLPNDSDCYYYETKTSIVIIFKTAISVQSHFTGFSQGNIYDIQKPFMKTSNYEMIQSKKKINIHNVSQRLIHDVDVNNLPKTKPTIGSNYQEGFTEGLKISTTDADSASWMECDNVDLDYSQEVPTYTSTSSSQTTPDKSIESAVRFTITVCGIILFLFVFPHVYFFLSKKAASNFVPNIVLVMFFIIGISCYFALIPNPINYKDILITATFFTGFSIFGLIYIFWILSFDTSQYLESYNLKSEGKFLGVFPTVIPI